MYFPGPCGPFGGNQSIAEVCGKFDDNPANPDQGSCHSLKVARTCAAPDLPVIQCNDANYQTVAQPGNAEHPFAVIAGLFDELCLPVTDQTGAQILTTIT